MACELRELIPNVIGKGRRVQQTDGFKVDEIQFSGIGETTHRAVKALRRVGSYQRRTQRFLEEQCISSRFAQEQHLGRGADLNREVAAIVEFQGITQRNLHGPLVDTEWQVAEDELCLACAIGTNFDDPLSALDELAARIGEEDFHERLFRVSHAFDIDRYVQRLAGTE